MATLKSDLVLSLIDRVSRPAGLVQRRLADLQGAARSNARQLDAMRGRMVEAGAVGYGLYRALAAPITTAAEFESVMFRVGDATKASETQMRALTDQARHLGRTTAYTATQAGEAQEMLAKNGLTTADVLNGATEASLRLAAATGSDLAGAADIATDVMASFNKRAEELAEVNNGIVGVLKASKFGIDDYRLALGQAGGVAGGLGVELGDFNAALATTSSLFASGSDAGTSFKTFLLSLPGKSDSALATINKFNLEFHDAAGNMRSMADVAEELRTKLGHLSEQELSTAMNDIFGTDAMRTGIGLMKAGAEGVNAMRDAISKGNAEESANARMQGLNGTLKELKSIFQDLNIAIGNAINPALREMGERLKPVLAKVGQLAEANPRLTSTIVALTAGLVALRIAAIAAQFSLLWMKGGLIAGAIAGLRGLGAAAKGTAVLLTPFTAAARAARTAMVGFTAAAAIGGTGAALKTMGAGLLGMLNPLRLVAGAWKAMRLAMIGTGIGAVVVGIAMAGTWIARNWAGVAEMFRGIGEGIRNAFPGAGATIDTVSAAVGTLFGWFEKLTGPVDATSTAWRALGITIGESIGGAITAAQSMIDWFAGFVGRIVTAIGSTDLTATGIAIVQSLWDGMAAKFNELIGWVTSIPAKLREAIGNIDLSNIVSWPKLPAWAGGSPAPEVGDGEHRAKGGPVNAGSLYTVGERGPELFVPNVSGQIVPNGALEEMRSQSSGRGASVPSAGSVTIGAPVITVNPGPGMDETALAEKVARAIDRTIKDTFAGGHWNGGYRVA